MQINEEVQAAYELGRKEGYDTCQAEKDESDFDQGYKAGYKAGYKEGYASAPQQLDMFGTAPLTKPNNRIKGR